MEEVTRAEPASAVWKPIISTPPIATPPDGTTQKSFFHWTTHISHDFDVRMATGEAIQTIFTSLDKVVLSFFFSEAAAT